MKPYYQDEYVTLYHSDCRAVLGELAPVDLVLTDPPYGIGESSRKQKTRGGRVSFGGKVGKFVSSTDFGFNDWDRNPAPDWILGLIREMSRIQIIFGGNYFNLPPSSCWLVWDKEQSGDFADCELAWTNMNKAIRRIKWRWNGMLQEDMSRKESRVHPTQKPLPVMRWCIQQAGDVQTILDPFTGSGTTLVAAKEQGLKSIGIEISEAYCEIAACRVQATQVSMFAHLPAEPEQAREVGLFQ